MTSRLLQYLLRVSSAALLMGAVAAQASTSELSLSPSSPEAPWVSMAPAPSTLVLLQDDARDVGRNGTRDGPRNFSVGFYAGQYYDTEPAGFLTGNANFKNHYLSALTASKTVWRSDTLPLSLEWDAMLGQQFGVESFTEVAIAPVLSWSGFPWSQSLQTRVRAGPLGLSYTTKINPLERGRDGKGSRLLNFLMLEAAFALPQHPAHELFVRLHHRCTIYDLMNDYGANGQDFFALGYRYRF